MNIGVYGEHEYTVFEGFYPYYFLGKNNSTPGAQIK